MRMYMQDALSNTKTDEFLTKLDVAGLFKVTPRCVDQWMTAGILPYFKLGKTVRFSRESIQAHLNNKFKRN